ncbi:MAG: DUF7594 domain-containing protein [Candidatus Merdivicinus sp.]|jgi:hypothetical protein
MAQTTVKLNATKTAMIDSKSPGTNYSTANSYAWRMNRWYCMDFEEIPAQYNGKVMRSVEVNLYATNITYDTGNSVSASALQSAWQESEITYGNSPRWNKLYADSAKMDEASGWKKLTYNKFINATLQNVIDYGIVIDSPDFESIKANFYTRVSQYPPYLNVMLEDPVFDVGEDRLSPTKGFAGKNIDNTFTFAVAPENAEFVGGVIPSPDQIVFRWRPLNGQATEITLPGNQTQYVVPAKTFTTDQIQWQITVVSGESSTTSNWYTLTTVDSKSSAEAVSPQDIVVDGLYPIEFRWNHIIETGSEQTKYELEYSENNGTSWTPLQSESTKNTFATIPANTLPSGNLQWRVRTYNTDNVAGNWSEPVHVIVRGRPAAPSITSISAEARPIVRWQSADQQAYEISVYSGENLICRTGEIAGTQKEKKITEYLAPGVYTIRVKIWNAYNMESDWGSGSVQVPVNQLVAPVISVNPIDGGVRISGGGDGYRMYYLLRDGIPIAKSMTADFYDYAASAGMHTYVIRGVTSADQYRDSEPKQEKVTVLYAAIAPADKLGEWVPLIYRRNSDPNWSENIQVMGQTVFAAGRSLPFFEFSEFRSNALSFVYSYRTKEEYDRIKNLLISGKTVRYRGKDGTAYWMVLTGLQTTADYLSKDFTLSAQEVDFVEKVEYEEV